MVAAVLHLHEGAGVALDMIDRVNGVLRGTDGTLGGVPAVDRDFVHAIYGNFVYVLAFVLVLTLVLLTRAFRSISVLATTPC